MNVSLTPQLETLVREKLKSGSYHSASEVVREALRLLQERDQLREARLAELRGQIAVGIEQAGRGDTVPLDAEGIKARGRKRRKGKA